MAGHEAGAVFQLLHSTIHLSSSLSADFLARAMHATFCEAGREEEAANERLSCSAAICERVSVSGGHLRAVRQRASIRSRDDRRMRK
jgi:hypothetical protein